MTNYTRDYVTKCLEAANEAIGRDLDLWRPTEDLFPGVKWRRNKTTDCEEYEAVAGGLYVCFHSVLGNFCGQTWPGDWNDEIRRPPEGLTPTEELDWFRMQCLESLRADAERVGLVLWKRGWGALGEGISIEQAARMNTEKPF